MHYNQFVVNLYFDEGEREILIDKVLKFDSKNPRAKEDAQFEYFVSAIN